MGLDEADKYLNNKRNQINNVIYELKERKLNLSKLEKLINLVINRKY